MVRLEEGVEDLRRRVFGGSRDLDQEEWSEARLLDLRKAYARVNKPALWMLLSRYGLGENMIRVIKGLHETTSYKVRGKEEVSGEGLHERGFREGWYNSAVLFNIHHILRIHVIACTTSVVDLPFLKPAWFSSSSFRCSAHRQTRFTITLPSTQLHILNKHTPLILFTWSLALFLCKGTMAHTFTNSSHSFALTTNILCTISITLPCIPSHAFLITRFSPYPAQALTHVSLL